VTKRVITCIAVTLAHAGSYFDRHYHVRHHNVTVSLQTSIVVQITANGSNDNTPFY